MVAWPALPRRRRPSNPRAGIGPVFPTTRSRRRAGGSVCHLLWRSSQVVGAFRQCRFGLARQAAAGVVSGLSCPWPIRTASAESDDESRQQGARRVLRRDGQEATRPRATHALPRGGSRNAPAGGRVRAACPIRGVRARRGAVAHSKLSSSRHPRAGCRDRHQRVRCAPRPLRRRIKSTSSCRYGRPSLWNTSWNHTVRVCVPTYGCSQESQG